MKPQPWLIVVFVAALVGLVFAGVSTYDFVQHLDRQVHSLHCSFIPGMGHETGESGCQVAMMSPYSSVFRSSVWGGIPISLPAMAVFAFIGVFAIDLMLTRRKNDSRATGFLLLATALPALTSVVMLTISLTQLGSTCKLCVCIYVASAVCLIGAIVLWRRALHPGVEPFPHPASNRFLAGAFGIGVLFVVVPVAVYLAKAPDHGRFVGTCGALAHPEDTYGVMVRVEAGSTGVPAIELLDPLCPACRAFEDRLATTGYADRLDRRAILFPLDNTCNWMVTEATHPGACTISEAVLCAGDRAPEVIAWAFDVQEQVRAETARDPAAAARIVKQRFPELAACVGSPEARSRLNKSLRWAVANNIQVLTPQLYIDGVKLCDEDVDLGLEYSLRIMIERHDAHTLAPPAGLAKPAEAVPADPHVTPPTAVEPAKPVTTEPAKPVAEPRKPAAVEPVKPATDEPATPVTTEPTKPAAEPTKPAVEEPVTPPPASGPVTSPAETAPPPSGSEPGGTP